MSLPSVPDGAVGVLPLSYIRVLNIVRSTSVAAGGVDVVEFLPINEEWEIQSLSYTFEGIPASTGNVIVEVTSLGLSTSSRVVYVGTSFVSFNNCPQVVAANIVMMQPRTDEASILSLRGTIVSSNSTFIDRIRILYHNGTNVAMVGTRQFTLFVKASPIIGAIAHG